MAPKCTPNIGNDPMCSYHNTLPGGFCSLKSLKCMFVAACHQADDLPKSGASRRDEGNDWLKHGEPESPPVNTTGIRQKK